MYLLTATFNDTTDNNSRIDSIIGKNDFPKHDTYQLRT